jgi:hypothetical protein
MKTRVLVAGTLRLIAVAAPTIHAQDSAGVGPILGRGDNPTEDDPKFQRLPIFCPVGETLIP